MEPLNVDKIFVGSHYGDYEWKLGCIPSTRQSLPTRNDGWFVSVYAWYTKTGEKVIANYTFADKSQWRSRRLSTGRYVGPVMIQRCTKYIHKVVMFQDFQLI